MNQFTYEDWLSGHATRKSMLEKLERSLIPYELFAQMSLATTISPNPAKPCMAIIFIPTR